MGSSDRYGVLSFQKGFFLSGTSSVRVIMETLLDVSLRANKLQKKGIKMTHVGDV